MTLKVVIEHVEELVALLLHSTGTSDPVWQGKRTEQSCSGVKVEGRRQKAFNTVGTIPI